MKHPLSSLSRKLILFVILTALQTNLTNTLQAQQPSQVTAKPYERTHKIVFQVTSADTMVHKSVIKQIANIKAVAPETQIEVVCHGPGIDMLLKAKTTVIKGILTTKELGVVFVACEFTLMEKKINKADIILEAGFVKAGIIEIVTLQEKGWSYIKAGF